MTVTLLLNSYLEYKEMLDKMNVIIVKTMRAMSVCTWCTISYFRIVGSQLFSDYGMI